MKRTLAIAGSVAMVALAGCASKADRKAAKKIKEENKKLESDN